MRNLNGPTSHHPEPKPRYSWLKILGNMKNVDLVKEFGEKEGFWSAFADGVDVVEVSEGKLRVKLEE
jgi:hypothetical protein